MGSSRSKISAALAPSARSSQLWITTQYEHERRRERYANRRSLKVAGSGLSRYDATVWRQRASSTSGTAIAGAKKDGKKP